MLCPAMVRRRFAMVCYAIVLRGAALPMLCHRPTWRCIAHAVPDQAVHCRCTLLLYALPLPYRTVPHCTSPLLLPLCMALPMLYLALPILCCVMPLQGYALPKLHIVVHCLRFSFHDVLEAAKLAASTPLS